MNQIAPYRHFMGYLQPRDRKLISAGMEVVAKHLSPLSVFETEEIENHCIWLYLANRNQPDDHPNIPKHRTASQTREELKAFIKSANDLIEKANKLWRNMYIGIPLLYKGFEFDFYQLPATMPTEKSEFQEDCLAGMISTIGLVSHIEIAENFLDSIPHEGGWHSKLRPHTVLIRTLGKWYTHKRKMPPLDGVKKIAAQSAAGEDEFFEGDFFDLIKEVFTALDVKKTNAAYAKMIYDALKENR